MENGNQRLKNEKDRKRRYRIGKRVRVICVNTVDTNINGY